MVISYVSFCMLSMQQFHTCSSESLRSLASWSLADRTSCNVFLTLALTACSSASLPLLSSFFCSCLGSSFTGFFTAVGVVFLATGCGGGFFCSLTIFLVTAGEGGVTDIFPTVDFASVLFSVGFGCTFSKEVICGCPLTIWGFAFWVCTSDLAKFFFSGPSIGGGWKVYINIRLTLIFQMWCTEMTNNILADND